MIAECGQTRLPYPYENRAQGQQELGSEWSKPFGHADTYLERDFSRVTSSNILDGEPEPADYAVVGMHRRAF
jgi:hypothetical protein